MPTNITIREGAKLRSKIENRLAELRNDLYRTSVSINLLDPDPIKEVNEVPEKVRTTFAQLTTLSSVLTAVRRLIDAANHTAPEGQATVSDLLAEIASLKAQVQVISPLTNAHPRLTDEQLVARIEGHRDMVLGPVVDEDVVGTNESDPLARLPRPRRRRGGPANRGGYGAPSEVMQVDVLPQDMIDTFKVNVKAMQNTIEKLHSRVEKLNNSITITVSDEAAAVLAIHEIQY